MTEETVNFRLPNHGGDSPGIGQPVPPVLPARVRDIYWIIPAVRIPVPRLRIAGITGPRVGGAEGTGVGVVLARRSIILTPPPLIAKNAMNGAQPPLKQRCSMSGPPAI